MSLQGYDIPGYSGPWFDTSTPGSVVRVAQRGSFDALAFGLLGAGYAGLAYGWVGGMAVAAGVVVLSIGVRRLSVIAAVVYGVASLAGVFWFPVLTLGLLLFPRWIEAMVVAWKCRGRVLPAVEDVGSGPGWLRFARFCGDRLGRFAG